MVKLNPIDKIEEVIITEIRPQLHSHDGDIKVEKFEDGILYIKLLGQCSGCPSAMITTEDIVKKQIMEKIPEVKDVVLNVQVSDELLDMAKRLLAKKKMM